MDTNTNNDNNKNDNNDNDNKNNDNDININELVIEILEDHGYSGIDLLNQLVQIYDIYQSQHVKSFIIKNYNYFVILKDTIWFNFEHTGNKLGISSLKDFGVKFPYLTHLFDGINIVPNIYLNPLLKEVNQVIQLWNNQEIMLANIYTNSDINIKGGDKDSTTIIIYNYNENPRKYLVKINKNDLYLMNDIDEDQLVFCKLLGKINKNEDGKIFYNILINLQNAIKYAIEYNKDLNLIVESS